MTGQLGRVMKESAQAALSYVRSHAAEFGIPMKLFKRCGIHVHVPKGAVPKDGPSAGVAIVTALASVLTGRPARADTAMTGEITLTGLVLPVGGIKEKVLAAHRAGIRRVVLPKANQGDLVKLPDQVRKDIEIVLVENISEALKETLSDQPIRVPTMDQMEDGEAPKESVESGRQAAAPASAQQPPA